MVGAPGSEEPEQLFLREALDEIEKASDTIQVGDLNNLLTGISNTTAKPPYSGADLRDSFRSLGPDSPSCSRPAGYTITEMPALSGDASGNMRREVTVAPAFQSDTLQVLLGWHETRNTEFPAILRHQAQLRGKGSKVVGGAAVAVLSFLELCTEATSLAGRYSATRTWNFFAGVQGTKAPEARTRIAPLFLIDEAASLDMLRRSDVLLWLALDVSTRRREVQALVEHIQPEEGQVARIARLQNVAVGQNE
jgi:hypothetical protein